MLRKESWKDWESNVLEIIKTALLELLKKDDLPVKEDDINRILEPILRRCRRDWCSKNDRELQGHPIYHAKGQPDEGDKEKQIRENKEAEFLWGFTDYLNDLDKNFTVECKNITHPPSSNSYYVTGGIKRFIHKDWSYGIHCESGLMIGYVQDIDLQTALDAINKYAQKDGIPILGLKGIWQKGGVSELHHVLDRPDIPVSPFLLRHFWIDLRKFYSLSQNKKTSSDSV